MPEGEVDCLTVDEELKLVAFYCRQTLQLGDHLKVPTDVKVWESLGQSGRDDTDGRGHRLRQYNTSNASTSRTRS
jgi:hypothetical protein